eukprot:tig00000113_g5691.t1
MGGACGRQKVVGPEESPWPAAKPASVAASGPGPQQQPTASAALAPDSKPAAGKADVDHDVDQVDVCELVARDRARRGKQLWRCICRADGEAPAGPSNPPAPCEFRALPFDDAARARTARELAGLILFSRLADEPQTSAALPLHAPGLSAAAAERLGEEARELAWDVLEQFARTRVTSAARSAEVAALVSCGDARVARKAIAALVGQLEHEDPSAADFEDAGAALCASLQLLSPRMLEEGALPRAAVKRVVRFCARLLDGPGHYLSPSHREALVLVRAVGSLAAALEAAGVEGAPGPERDDDARRLHERLRAFAKAGDASWWLAAHAREAAQALLLLERGAGAVDRFVGIMRRLEALFKAAKSAYKIAALALDAARSFGVSVLIDALAERQSPWEHVEKAFAEAPDAPAAWYVQGRYLRALLQAGRLADVRSLMEGAARADLRAPDGRLAASLAAALYDAACESEHEAVWGGALSLLARLARTLAEEEGKEEAEPVAVGAALLQDAGAAVLALAAAAGRPGPEGPAYRLCLSALAAMEAHAGPGRAPQAARAASELEGLASGPDPLPAEVRRQREAAPAYPDSLRPLPVRRGVLPRCSALRPSRSPPPAGLLTAPAPNRPGS